MPDLLSSPTSHHSPLSTSYRLRNPLTTGHWFPSMLGFKSHPGRWAGFVVRLKETENTVSHLWRNHPDSAYSIDEVGVGILSSGSSSSSGLGSSVTPYSISLDALGLSPLSLASNFPRGFPPYLLNELSLAHLPTIDFANFSQLLGAMNSHGCWVKNLILLVLNSFCLFFNNIECAFLLSCEKIIQTVLLIRWSWSWDLSLGSSSAVISWWSGWVGKLLFLSLPLGSANKQHPGVVWRSALSFFRRSGVWELGPCTLYCQMVGRKGRAWFICSYRYCIATILGLWIRLH